MLDTCPAHYNLLDFTDGDTHIKSDTDHSSSVDNHGHEGEGMILKKIKCQASNNEN
jgi:hypothetical protein